MIGPREPGSGTAASVLLAGAVGLLALPSAVLAFTADFSVKEASPGTINSAGQAEAAPKLSRALAIRSLAKGQLFPFTPAGIPEEADRSVTVAVRVDSASVRAITVNGRRSIPHQETDSGHLRIAPTGFNLGISRGYRNFAQDIAQTNGRQAADLPELPAYSLAPSRHRDESRFSPRIVLEERATTGRAPRTFAVNGGEVDLGGAYRVTDNLNVTAGVRYSQERERLAPLTTDGKQDSQAVYVGTQFKF